MNHAELAKNSLAVYEEINDLFMHIADACDDVNICYQSKQFQSVILLALNRPLDIIDLFPDIKQPMITSDTIIAQAYTKLNKQNDANEILQIYQYQYLHALIQNISSYIYFNSSNISKIETAANRLLQLIDIYEFEKIHPSIILSVYANLAIVYINLKKPIKTLEYLKNYVDIAITLKFPLVLKGDSYFDQLDNWFHQLDLDILAPRSDRAIIKSIKAVLANPIFKPIQNNIEYQQLIDKLNQHLGGSNNEY